MGGKLADPAFAGADPHGFQPHDLSNLRQPDSSDLFRNPSSGTDREQQFVIFAAVEGKIQIDLVAGFADAGPRNRYRFNFRSDPTLLTDVRQVGREPITGIDHCGSQTLLPQHTAKFDSRLRIKMSAVVPWTRPTFIHLPNGSRRPSEFPTDENPVSGPSA